MNATQRGHSWAIPVSAGAAARIPAWTSRAQWQLLVHLALATERGHRIRNAEKVSCSSVIAVAVTMSRFASSRTGRDVTASNFVLAGKAGVSERVVSRARKVLQELGLAVEVERGRRLSPIERAAARAHHGGWQTTAASVWYLTVPKTAVPHLAEAMAARGRRIRRRRTKAVAKHRENPQAAGSGDLPPSRGVSSFCSVGSNSPTPAENRGAAGISTTSRHERRPRPLHLQRAAAELVRHAPALSHGHIGAVCQAILAAGIDTTRYGGRDIATCLTRDTQDRGWTWPNRIARPRAFLTARLSMLGWSGPSPTEQAAARAEERARQRRAEAEAAAQRLREAPPASDEQRARSREQFRAAMRKKDAARRAKAASMPR